MSNRNSFECKYCNKLLTHKYVSLDGLANHDEHMKFNHADSRESMEILELEIQKIKLELWQLQQSRMLAHESKI